MPGVLTALFAFLATPLGKALSEEAPKLIAKVIGVWAQQGKVTPEQIAAFIEDNWLKPEDLVPPPPGATTP